MFDSRLCVCDDSEDSCRTAVRVGGVRTSSHIRSRVLHHEDRVNVCTWLGEILVSPSGDFAVECEGFVREETSRGYYPLCSCKYSKKSYEFEKNQ